MKRVGIALKIWAIAWGELGNTAFEYWDKPFGSILVFLFCVWGLSPPVPTGYPLTHAYCANPDWTSEVG